MSENVVDTSFLNETCQKLLAAQPPEAKLDLKFLEFVRQLPILPLSEEEYPRPAVTIEKIHIPASDGHPIDVDVYRPKDIVPADKVLPVVVYLPGGGFCFPAQGGHPYLASKLAGDAECVVLLVNYSLAPEVKFPGAIEECYSVIKHVTSAVHAKQLNVDPTRVSIGGDSAGGSICAALTLLEKERKDLENGIKYQFLYYPVLGDFMDSESYRKYGKGFFLTKAAMEFVISIYIDEKDKDSLLFRSINATTDDLTGLPPTLIVNGEADVLCDEGELYGRKLRKAKVPVTSVRINGMLHGFMSTPELHCDETDQVIALTVDSLRRVNVQ